MVHPRGAQHGSLISLPNWENQDSWAEVECEESGGPLMGARARQGSSAKLNHLGGGVVTGSWSPFCLFMTADFLSLASAKNP